MNKLALASVFFLFSTITFAHTDDGVFRINGADCSALKGNGDFHSIVVGVSNNKARVSVYNGPRNPIDMSRGLAIHGEGESYSMPGFPNSSSETVIIKLDEELKDFIQRPYLVLSSKIFSFNSDLPSGGHLSNPMTEDDDIQLNCSMYRSSTNENLFVNNPEFVQKVEHPSICTIEFLNPPLTNFWTHGCTATVVGENKLLSAAHCQESFAKTQTRVRCGNDLTWRKIVRWEANPEFRPIVHPIASSHDISILTLDSTGDSPSVKIEKELGEVQRLVIDNKNCRHYGMGNRQDRSIGGLYTSPLRHPQDILGGMDNLLRIFEMSNMITSDPTYFVRSGDSGGPIICENEEGQDVIVGVHSFISTASGSAKSAMTALSWDFIEVNL